MLSLIELQNKKVEAKRKKYEKDEMDAYLELVFENYKNLLEENRKLEAEKAELNKKIKTLSDGVQYYRSIETTLQKALILAEKTSKETKDAAILKAESIEKEAHKRADHIIHNAEDEYNKIRNKCVRLVQQFNQYKLQLKEAASAQLQLVEGDEFDISKPDELEKPLEVSNQNSAPKKPEPAEEAAPKKPETLKPQVEEESTEVKKEAVEQSVPEENILLKEPVVSEKKEDDFANAATEEILNADTIDLRDTLNTVNQLDDTNKLEVPKTATVEKATIVEPVKAKTIEPLDITFEDEIAANEEKKNDIIEPPKPSDKNNDSVPTLDSLLQDLNMNNKNSQKSDDPFEFLGSVDDF